MDNTATTLRQLNGKDFLAFGVNHVAYIKRIKTDEGEGYSIHAADGTPLTVLEDRETAFAAVRQHDLEPVSVH